MFRRIFSSVFILLLVPAIFITIVNAQDNGCHEPGSGDSQETLTRIRDACISVKNQLATKRDTLASQIKYMNSQMYLTELEITNNTTQIAQLKTEIASLGTRIEELDTTLTNVSISVNIKIEETYKQQKNATTIQTFFNAGNLPSLLRSMQYLQKTQKNDRNLLLRVQDTKVNFQEQKILREEKEVELARLTEKLEQYKVDLGQQQAEKRRLLDATQNDEAVYQQILSRAQAQLAGFTAFTSSAGGGITSFGSGSNGWYYTQRDPSWGNITLPGSSSSVMVAGCAVTSVAMVCKSYGQSVNPATIANNPSNFIGGDLWNWAFSCSGKGQSWISPTQENVRSYVDRNIPVILRLVAPSVSGLHFVVAWKWDSGANDFIIHDPYYGPDLKFQSRYNWSQISQAVAIF